MLNQALNKKTIPIPTRKWELPRKSLFKFPIQSSLLAFWLWSWLLIVVAKFCRELWRILTVDFCQLLYNTWISGSIWVGGDENPRAALWSNSCWYLTITKQDICSPSCWKGIPPKLQLSDFHPHQDLLILRPSWWLWKSRGWWMLCWCCFGGAPFPTERHCAVQAWFVNVKV